MHRNDRIVAQPGNRANAPPADSPEALSISCTSWSASRTSMFSRTGRTRQMRWRRWCGGRHARSWAGTPDQPQRPPYLTWWGRHGAPTCRLCERAVLPSPRETMRLGVIRISAVSPTPRARAWPWISRPTSGAPGWEHVVHYERHPGVGLDVAELLGSLEGVAADIDGVQLCVVPEADRHDVRLPVEPHGSQAASFGSAK